jgi:hypothetical protein
MRHLDTGQSARCDTTWAIHNNHARFYLGLMEGTGFRGHWGEPSHDGWATAPARYPVKLIIPFYGREPRTEDAPWADWT